MSHNLMRALEALSLIADEAAAQRIIEHQRLCSAEHRLWLIETKDRHMCLTPGCRKPVVGKLIFAHCERHLEKWEKRWLEEEVETKPYTPPEQDEHPLVRASRELLEKRDSELVQLNVEKKEKAIKDANDLIESYRHKRGERAAYLPKALFSRIEEALKTQEEAVGYDRNSDLPL
jgi:hypothetical protein